MFLDGSGAKARDAVRVIFSGEKVRPDQRAMQHGKAFCIRLQRLDCKVRSGREVRMRRTSIECTSAIARLELGGALSSRQSAQAIDVLRSLAVGWNEILPSESVRETACRLLRVHALRAADAMQLAAAIVMAGGRTAQAGFLAFDERLRDAAGREGFLVGP
ncbi:MAG: PIN domain-containing protein [Pirellulales bacterium]|jgi:predicted nucleic acid-binding protein